MSLSQFDCVHARCTCVSDTGCRRARFQRLVVPIGGLVTPAYDVDASTSACLAAEMESRAARRSAACRVAYTSGRPGSARGGGGGAGRASSGGAGGGSSPLPPQQRSLHLMWRDPDEEEVEGADGAGSVEGGDDAGPGAAADAAGAGGVAAAADDDGAGDDVYRVGPLGQLTLVPRPPQGEARGPAAAPGGGGGGRSRVSRRDEAGAAGAVAAAAPPRAEAAATAAAAAPEWVCRCGMSNSDDAGVCQLCDRARSSGPAAAGVVVFAPETSLVSPRSAAHPLAAQPTSFVPGPGMRFHA
jgi:hypothetical protein